MGTTHLIQKDFLMSLKIGTEAEVLALAYLQKQGLSLKVVNFRCKMGEVDLIMQDGIYLVFVEVRMRTSDDYGGALASITVSKQCKIKNTAKLYLLENNLYDKCPVRFDVLTIQGATSEVSWIKNAFM